MGLEIGTNLQSPEEIADRLRAVCSGDLMDVRAERPDTVLARCAAASLKGVAGSLKSDAEVGYETLSLITGVDWRTRMECVYQLYSWKTNTFLELHVELPADAAEVDTVCDLWPSAEWLEREAFDMLGIRFRGHPDLRRILLKDDFVGHPLRKDYVDLAENHPHA